MAVRRIGCLKKGRLQSAPTEALLPNVMRSWSRSRPIAKFGERQQAKRPPMAAVLASEDEATLRAALGLASQKPQSCEPGAEQEERCRLGHRSVLLESVYNLDRTGPIGRRR